jgi:hypothetical protein
VNGHAAEVAYYQLKVTLRGAGTRLRAHTPQVARQEIWALLTVYNMLVDWPCVPR